MPSGLRLLTALVLLGVCLRMGPKPAEARLDGMPL
jgi:hypothetical protein